MEAEGNTKMESSSSAPLRALIVASDSTKRRELANVLSAQGAHVREVESVPLAWDTLGAEPFDVVVPVGDVLQRGGGELVAELSAFDEAIAVVAVADSNETARRALAAGAYDVFTSPVDDERLKVVLRHIDETARLRTRSEVLDKMMNGGAHIGALLTRDPRMIAVVNAVRRLARYRTPVLIVGERGTEHEEVARALHDLGRPDGPFVVCDATSLSVAELRDHLGRASAGTIFVDDVTALAPDVSAALSVALDELGTDSDSRAPRVVAGCPQASPPPVTPGDPRADLYAHLTRTTLVLPPLRERRNDAVLVARELAAGVGRDRGRELALARPVEDALLSYPWPGNLDELKSVVVTAATTANGPTIEVQDLPAPLAEHAGSSGQPVTTRRLRDLEMQHLRQVLEETRGNKSRAARILGLSRWALQRKLRKHGISLEDPPAA